MTTPENTIQAISAMLNYSWMRSILEKQPLLSLSVGVIFDIANARQHWSSEALAQRKVNRKIYFDTKYPERPSIIQPGDKQW